MIQALNDLPVNLVKEVSPDSLDLKKYVKVPLLLFVIGASMLASISDLQLKLIGAIVEEANKATDYLCLMPLLVGVAYSASQTLVFVNQAMKYYD